MRAVAIAGILAAACGDAARTPAARITPAPAAATPDAAPSPPPPPPIDAAVAAAVPAPATDEEDDVGEVPEGHAAPAKGPYASLDAYCAAQQGVPADGCKPAKIKQARRKLQPPWKDARAYELVLDPDVAEGVALLVELEDGWYSFDVAIWSTSGADHGDGAVKSVRTEDVVPGGAHELLVETTRGDFGFTHEYEEFGTRTETLWVCALPATGAPQCAGFLTAEHRRGHPHDDPADHTSYKYKLDLRFDAQGRVVRKLKGKAPRGVDLSSYTTPTPFVLAPPTPAPQLAPRP